MLRKENVHITVKNLTIQPSQLLKGRTAYITGGTSGIGLAIAKSFLQAGANVIISGRSMHKLNYAVSELTDLGKPLGSSIKGILSDISTDDSDTLLSKVLQLSYEFKDSTLDILVNNAGIGGGMLPYVNEIEYSSIMDTNLKGTFFLSQSFGKYMVKNRLSGNILNISSASSLRPANSAYMLSKWGVRGLTLGLAKSLGKYGITCNAIAPGPTATPMLGHDENNLYHPTSPIKRYILPSEIGNIAVMLVSAMGKSIVGDTIYMTGGVGLITYDDFEYPGWD